MIVYVCSPLASATNGAALRVDGGVVRVHRLSGGFVADRSSTKAVRGSAMNETPEPAASQPASSATSARS